MYLFAKTFIVYTEVVSCLKRICWKNKTEQFLVFFLSNYFRRRVKTKTKNVQNISTKLCLYLLLCLFFQLSSHKKKRVNSQLNFDRSHWKRVSWVLKMFLKCADRETSTSADLFPQLYFRNSLLGNISNKGSRSKIKLRKSQSRHSMTSKTDTWLDISFVLNFCF